VLVRDELNPLGIAVDSTHVYYTRNDAGAGAVVRIPKQGGEPEVVATRQLDPVQVVLTSSPRPSLWIGGSAHDWHSGGAQQAVAELSEHGRGEAEHRDIDAEIDRNERNDNPDAHARSCEQQQGNERIYHCEGRPKKVARQRQLGPRPESGAHKVLHVRCRSHREPGDEHEDH
jgi:hypothetical protein